MNELAERSISVSEMKRFLTCRLRWSWASAPPRGRGLAPQIPVPELQLGRVIHETLQQGYDSQRPFEDVYWELVGDTADGSGGLFEDYHKELMRDRELGAEMMRNYQDWSRTADEKYQFLATETQADGIEMPGTEATMSVILDAVVEADDGPWVLDFKTTSYTSVPWTTQDIQATAYTYAARQLFGEDIQGVIFRFLLKKAPWDYHDLILKSGRVTKRSNIDNLTTYENYYRALGVATLKSMVENQGFEWEGPMTLDAYNEALSWIKDHEAFRDEFLKTRRLYYSELQQVREGLQTYFWEIQEVRTHLQVENYMTNLLVPTCNEIINPDKWIGPTGLGVYRACSRCPYKMPCKMAMDGGPYEELLDNEYELSEHYQQEVDNEGDD